MTEYKIGDNVVFTTNQGQSSGQIINVEDDYFDGVRVGIKYTIYDTAGNTYFNGFTNKGINTNNVEIKHKLGGGRRRMKSKRKIMRKKSTRRRK